MRPNPCAKPVAPAANRRNRRNRRRSLLAAWALLLLAPAAAWSADQ
jgi:hypothetical protein